MVMIEVDISREEVEEAIIAFAAARGNINLAAERLHIPPTRLRQLIAEDPDLLTRHLKTQAIISTYEVMAQAHDSMKVALTTMEPYEVSKTYTSLLNNVTELVRRPPADTSPNQNTITQNFLNVLPVEARAEVQEAMRVLQLNPEAADGQTDSN